MSTLEGPSPNPADSFIGQGVSSQTANLEPHLPSLAGRAYRCQCGCPVFFRNSVCLACGTPLGYESSLARLIPLMPHPDLAPGAPHNSWVIWHDAAAGRQPLQSSPGADPNALPSFMPQLSQAYARCANLQTPAQCNWLIPITAPAPVNNAANAANDAPAGGNPLAMDAPAPLRLLCQACRLNRVIPDLNDAMHPDNGELWGRIELAKRRLVSALMALGLPVASRLSEDTARGMMFDFLRSPNNGPHILTGHDTGLITLNLQEADDAVREAARTAMREPYRTLLGHFRHEIGHYYWDRLVRGTHWMDGFHQLFGDETIDYATALRKNYEQGPPQQWWLHYVSAYASTHPWEDWAECWAHYLHMRDTVDTALSFGLATDRANLEFTLFTLDALYQPDHPQAEQFLAFLNEWTQLTTLLNEMSRSMGQPDFYPFVLPREVVAKLHFIHLLVTSSSWLPGDVAAVEAAQDALTQQIDGHLQIQGQDQGQSQSQSQGYSQGLDQVQSHNQGQSPAPLPLQALTTGSFQND